MPMQLKSAYQHENSCSAGVRMTHTKVQGALEGKQCSLRKTVGKVSPILVTLTSSSDSNFERSNISLKENIPDDVDPNSKGHNYCVRKNEGKILWFSAD